MSKGRIIRCPRVPECGSATRNAEARSSIPVWVWVMSLFVVAWAVWYAARMWEVPEQYAQTPTYRSQASTRPSDANAAPGWSAQSPSPLDIRERVEAMRAARQL